MDRLTSLLSFFQPQPTAVYLHGAMPLNVMINHHVVKNAIYSDVIYVIQGAVEVATHEKTQTIRQGELVWLPEVRCSVVQAETDDACWLTLSYQFGPMHLNIVLGSLPSILKIPDVAAHPELTVLVSLLAHEIEGSHCGYQQAIRHLMNVLLIPILRVLVSSMTVEYGVIGGLSDPRLARALVKIHDYPDKAWNLATLAQAAGMSRTAFSQYFKTKVGCSAVEYLKQWRMQLAYQYLCGQQLSVAQIADQLGYKSETAFRRVFRQVMGITPGAVRASNKF